MNFSKRLLMTSLLVFFSAGLSIPAKPMNKRVLFLMDLFHLRAKAEELPQALMPDTEELPQSLMLDNERSQTENALWLTYKKCYDNNTSYYPASAYSKEESQLSYPEPIRNRERQEDIDEFTKEVIRYSLGIKKTCPYSRAFPEFPKLYNNDEQKQKNASLITKIIQNERKYANCYVFYHGCSGDYSTKDADDIGIGILSYVYRAIASWQNERRKKNLFPRIREEDFSEFMPEKESYQSPVQLFLEKTKDMKIDQKESWNFDGQKKIRKVLLSVNTSLFSNYSKHADGESSLFYFLNSFDQLHNSPFGGNRHYAIETLNQVFDAFGFNKKYIDEIITAYKNTMGGTGGQLLQIFIDKTIAHKYVYLARAGGKPVTFDNDSNFGSNLENSLESAFNCTVQARILAHPDLFADQKHVKTFCYTADRQLTPQEEQDLESELYKIFGKIFAELKQ